MSNATRSIRRAALVAIASLVLAAPAALALQVEVQVAPAAAAAAPATAVILSSDVNPSGCGAKVVLTATVFPKDATGPVRFQDGGAVLGESPVTNGVATLSVTSLEVGKHDLIAIYLGYGGNPSSASPPYSQAVEQGGSEIRLASDPDTTIVSDPFTLVATVTPSRATGTVGFFNALPGGELIGEAPLVDGVATLANVSVGPDLGAFPYRAVYHGDDCLLGSFSEPDTHYVAPIPTTTSIESKYNPTECENTLIRATVTSREGAPGEVAFYDGDDSLATVSLVQGVAELYNVRLAIGEHQITARYLGLDRFAPSTSPPLTQVIVGLHATVTLGADRDRVPLGEEVRFTANLFPKFVSGTVTLFEEGVSLGSTPVEEGLATLAIRFGSLYEHRVTARYNGDACFDTSRSNDVFINVERGLSAVTLSSSANPSTCLEAFDLTATVSPSDATGDVTFFRSGLRLDTVPVVNGVATLEEKEGIHAGVTFFTAVYSGDLLHEEGTSEAYRQVIDALPSSTEVRADLNPVVQAVPVDIVAFVTPAPAIGSVAFYDGTTLLGSPRIAGSWTQVTVAFAETGTHTITAVYSGDDICRGGSTSGPYSLEVTENSAVLLSLFEANTVNEGVELRWQFADAQDLADSWVERATSAAGPWTRVAMAAAVRDGITTGVDRDVEASATYSYRLVAALVSGGTQAFGPIDGRAGERVTEFALARIAPNPANDLARIEYTLPREARVAISIEDLQGRTVASLVDGVVPAGRHQATWVRKGGGASAPAGVYFVRYRTPNKVTTKRLVLQ